MNYFSSLSVSLYKLLLYTRKEDNTLSQYSLVDDYDDYDDYAES